MTERERLELIVNIGGYSALTADDYARLKALRDEPAVERAPIEQAEETEDDSILDDEE